MGLFSRREKTPKSSPTSADPPLHSSYSTASVNSSASRGIVNRISAASSNNNPITPLSPNTPFKMNKTDLPRPPDPQLDPAGYLRSLAAVRERSEIIFEKAVKNELRHFDVDMSKMDDVVSFVSGLIKVSFCLSFCLHLIVEALPLINAGQLQVIHTYNTSKQSKKTLTQ